MQQHHQTEDVEAQPSPEEDAERTLREALARIDRVDDVQQRFLSEARRQVSELHLQASRARAAVVAEAEAEAASLLEAARQEAARLRAESEQEVKAHAEVLMAVAHKERDDLMAAARAEADRIREEAAAAAESMLNTAQDKAVRLVQEGKEEAARIRAGSDEDQLRLGERPAGRVAVAQEADLRRLQQELRTLTEGLGQALDCLAEQIAAVSRQAPVTAPAPSRPDAPAPEPSAAPRVPAAAAGSSPVSEDLAPLIGSRGNQGAPSAQPSPDSPSPGAAQSEVHTGGAGRVGPASQWGHSTDWPRSRRDRVWRRGT